MAIVVKLENYDIDESAFALKNLMDGVLERIVAIYESYGVPLPAKRYWTMTSPAIDCEQLVVSFQQAYLGTPGDQASDPQRCNSPRSAVLVVSVARAVPVVGQSGQAPSPQKIQEASGITAVDGWILLQSLNLLDQWDDDGLYGLGVIATLTAGETSGGYQTVSMQVTLGVP